jgi:hypothetical protein
MMSSHGTLSQFGVVAKISQDHNAATAATTCRTSLTDVVSPNKISKTFGIPSRPQSAYRDYHSTLTAREI